jgi:hypothetical protein
MESSDKIQIEKLRGSDALWKVLMELLLTEKGLEMTIAEETRTQEELDARSTKDKSKEASDQKKALAAIGLRVQPEFLGVVMDAKGSARSAWLEF